MPRGVDTRHDPRRQPLPSWLTEGLKPGEAGSALPSIGGLLGHMREREQRPATIEQGMEARAWKYLGQRGGDED